jgi:hypothetical protein
MTIEDARQKLPLDALMAYLGHHEAAKPRARSPFRDDKTPSFGIYRAEDGRLRWKDHATGDGGDEVDYLVQFYGCSPADAAKKFLELAGGDYKPEQPRGAKYKIKKAGEPAQQKPPVFSWQEYRQRATPEFLAEMAKQRALSVGIFEEAHRLGIIGATETGHPAFVVNGGSACHYRVEDGSWRYEPRGAQVQPLCLGSESAKDAWVFESQWDALAILDAVGIGVLDSVRIVITRGAQNGKLAAAPCEGKIVTAWPQNDSIKANGKIPSEEWLADVRANTNQCRVVKIPGQHKDANDWVESGATREAIIAAVKSAVLPELVGVESFGVHELLAFKAKDDPTMLLGVRWICRGGSALIVGPAGIGKSSLAFQLSVLWAIGLPAVGIKPVRPLKSVFLQAENDEGDMAEMVQGVLQYALKTALEANMTTELVTERLAQNLIICRDTMHSGESFAKTADTLAGLHKPDLFWCDPLLSYVGDDISSQRVASNFLRGLLNPISFRHGFAWMMIHHTGKPPTDAKARQKWTESDFSYIGLGSSELTNWARACLYLQQLEDGLFCLHLTKRGKRAGISSGLGFPITKIGLEHGEKYICWEPCDLPSEEDKKKRLLSDLQCEEVVALRKQGKSMSVIIAEIGLKNSNGGVLSKGTLCKIMKDFEAKNGGKK